MGRYTESFIITSLILLVCLVVHFAEKDACSFRAKNLNIEYNYHWWYGCFYKKDDKFIHNSSFIYTED